MSLDAPAAAAAGLDAAADDLSWLLLTAELDAWAAAGRVANFWWRDDDATRPGPALDRLLAARARHAVPLGLAVIPAGATEALAGRLATEDAVVTVLQHGWSHADHGGPEGPKTELADGRPEADLDADLRAGRQRIAALFGDRARAVMVPPWNRIGARVRDRLQPLGYVAVSGMGLRGDGVAGLRSVNVHLDIVDWHGTGGFRGDAAVLGEAVAHLRARREGNADPEEPTGLMTHHIVHDEACWAFLERFLATVRCHPAGAWPGLDALLGADG